MGALLLALPLEAVPDRLEVLEHGVQAAGGRLYVHLTGGRAVSARRRQTPRGWLLASLARAPPTHPTRTHTGEAAARPPSLHTLDALAVCFEVVARLRPRLDVLPLLPCAGWGAPQLAALPSLSGVLAAEDSDADAAAALLRDVNAARAGEGHPPLALTLVPLGGGGSETAAGCAQPPPQQQPADPGSRVLGAPDGGDKAAPLQFACVAAGGTFDRLHAGHRLLLAATALVGAQRIFVGVTGARGGRGVQAP